IANGNIVRCPGFRKSKQERTSYCREDEALPPPRWFGHLNASVLCESPRSVVRWAQGSLTSLPSSRQQDLTTQQQAESNWRIALQAAEAKKAHNLLVLDLREITSFTDFFVICSVNNPRQGHAVSDEIHKQLKELGELPVSLEGYEHAEWILVDY